MRRLAPWLAVGVFTVALTAVTTFEALDRYRELRSGWSWDLAYYNQWFWALTRGDGVLSVRPAASYANEGPSVWKMNYLAPIRFAIAPVYWFFPDPKTLLVVQNVMFWWIIPAAFMLARSESKSNGLALTAALLVPATPLLWPLVWNDFRELQLALPFVLWTIDGWRGRSKRLAALGIAGMLACRQEFAAVVLSLIILPPRQPENAAQRRRWYRAAVLIGGGWILLFFVYLRSNVASNAPDLYVQEFNHPRAPLVQTLATSLDFLAVGLGSWAVFACFAPRVAILALPWLWSLANGRWALRFLATAEWHHVRYTAPMVALTLAAGLVGYARIGNWLLSKRRGWFALVAIWLGAALGFSAANFELQKRFARIPRPISREEAVALWRLIERVAPDDGVVAHYEVTAPLSSRRELFSYVLDANKPRRYPHMEPNIHWVFIRKGDLDENILTDQGFVILHVGPHMLVFHRAAPANAT